MEIYMELSDMDDTGLVDVFGHGWRNALSLFRPT